MQRKPAQLRIVIRDGYARVPTDAFPAIAQMVPPTLITHRQQGQAICILRRQYLKVRRGLVPRMCDHLETSGYEIEILDRRTSAPVFLSKRSGQVSTFHQKVSEVATAAMKQGCGGIFSVCRFNDALEIIAELRLLAPRENILIVAKNRDVASRIASRLERLIDMPVGCNAELDANGHPGPHFHVDNMQSFIGRNVERWGIVIAADLASARASTVLDQLACMDRSLAFAILPNGCKLDSDDQALLEAYYGPTIYRERGDAAELINVQVAWLDRITYPNIYTDDPLDRKQTLFWNNPGRNRPICQTAHAIRTLDAKTLSQAGILDTELLQSTLRTGTPPSVCVLVESIKHGSNLSKLLPEWPVLSSDDFIRGEPELPLMKEQAIVTLPRAYQQGLGFDVVIRAAGTEQTWKDAYGPHVAINGQHMLIIDIRDDVDERAHRARTNGGIVGKECWRIFPWAAIFCWSTTRAACAERAKPVCRETWRASWTAWARRRNSGSSG